MVDFTDNDEIIQAAPPQTVTPMKVTAVAVIAIILGCLYLLGGIGGGAALAVQAFAPGLFESDIETDDPGLKLQMEFQQKINALGKRFFWPNVVLTIAFTAIGAMLLVHSIQSLRLDEARQYRSLTTWLMIAMAAEILAIILGSIYQYGQWSLVQELSLPPKSGAQANVFKTILLYSTLFGIGVAWFWFIGKLVYLTLGTMVLKNHALVVEQSEQPPVHPLS